MKIAFDTNIILDAAMDCPGSDEAQALIQAVISGKITGIITANSITDIHYIVRKRVSEEAARTAVYNTLSIFDTTSVDAQTCMEALNLPMDDYEDAVLAVCAAREKADYIATRDAGFIAESGSPVKALAPAEILNLL